MKNHFVEEYLSMPAEKRRRLRIGVQRGSYNKPAGPFTRDYIIDWAKNNNITTRDKLNKIRKQGDPNYNLICKEFGNWNLFKQEVIGKPNFEIYEKPRTDARYLLQLVVQFNAWSRDSYRECHHKRPDIFPSEMYIRREFGTWKNLKKLANDYSTECMLKKYMLLRKKYGKWPTPSECTRERIDLRLLVTIFHSKKKLEDFLENMEKAD